VGQRIYAIGSPYGFENTMTEGIVSGLRSSFDSTRSFIQISAPISSGSSGGAILNAKGELIGISTMVISGETAQNLNFALPINDVIYLSKTSNAKPNNPKDISVLQYYQNGQREFMAKNYSLALFNYRAALQICSDKEQIGAFYYCIGYSHQRMNNYDSAVFYYDKSLLKVISSETYMRLGEIKADQSDFQRAGLYFEKAISENPNGWEAYNNLGIMYFKQKEYVKAIEQFKSSLKLHAKNPNAFYMLGKIADETQKNDLAISFFESAIQINPQFAEAYLALSTVYLKNGEMENAIKYQQKAYQLNPQLRNKKL
jgi:tetratricopeptide (TPR) repeat protein